MTVYNNMRSYQLGFFLCSNNLMTTRPRNRDFSEKLIKKYVSNSLHNIIYYNTYMSAKIRNLRRTAVRKICLLLQ